MACLAHDALVDAIDEHGRSTLVAAARLRAGDFVLDPVRCVAVAVVRVHHFVCKRGVWRIHRYMGLRADGAQRIWASHAGFQRLRDVPGSTAQIERSPVLVALVLDKPRAHVLVDGVVCCCAFEMVRASAVCLKLRGARAFRRTMDDDRDIARDDAWRRDVGRGVAHVDADLGAALDSVGGETSGRPDPPLTAPLTAPRDDTTNEEGERDEGGDDASKGRRTIVPHV